MKRVALALVACFWATGALADYAPPNPLGGWPRRAYCTEEFNDLGFTSGTLSTSGEPFFNSSTTSSMLVEAAPITGYGGVVTDGLVRQSSATGATDEMGVRTSTQAIKLGHGAVSFVAYGQEVTASNATDRYIEKLGLIDSDTTPTDAVEFRYSDNVNSGKWQAVTRAAGTETATDTGITFTATTVRKFDIEINAAATSVDFYIDDVKVVAAQSTNIPTGTNYTGVGWVANRTTGTTNAVTPMAMDYIAYRIALTTPRC